MSDYSFIEITDKMREEAKEIKVKGSNDIIFDNPQYKIVKHNINLEFDEDDEGNTILLIKQSRRAKEIESIIYNLDMVVDVVKRKTLNYLQKRERKADETIKFIWTNAINDFIKNTVEDKKEDSYLQVLIGNQRLTIYDFYELPKNTKT